MPFAFKIALFWLAVWCAIKLLQRRPDSFLSGIAFSWYGPFPIIGERRSAFYVRQMRFALGWLNELLFVTALLFVAVRLIPGVDEFNTVVLFCMFAMTLGLGMSILGAILAALVAAKALVIGPNPEFAPTQEPAESGDEGDD